MIKQTVVWTALPNGINPATGGFRLSVFISPRLQTDQGETLALFPDFVDWPSHLQPGQMTFTVQVGDVGPSFPLIIGPTDVSVISKPPDSGLWRSLYTASTFVKPHQFTNLTNRVVASYRAAPLVSHLKSSYQRICATSPVKHPSLANMEVAFGALHEAFKPRKVVTIPNQHESIEPSQIQAILAANLFRPDSTSDLTQNISRAIRHARLVPNVQGALREIIPSTDDPASASHFAQLAVFHRGPVIQEAAAPPDGPAAAGPIDEKVPARVVDFHQSLTALGEYSELMRRLGLVVDLELPASTLLGSPSGLPIIRVIPTFTNALAGQNYSPFTAYVPGDTLENEHFFMPAPRDFSKPEIDHGLLSLQIPGAYDLVQIDVDGAGLKAINMAATQNRRASPTAPTPDDTQTSTVPWLRTSGVSITRANHAAVLNDRFNTALGHNSRLESDIQSANGPTSSQSASVLLHAEDLVRGYRIDVFDSKSRRWNSLHRRVGTYTLTDHPGSPLSMRDEGAVQPSVTHPVPNAGQPLDPTPDLYIHESLCHWMGWSLAAPRPGKTLNDDGKPDDTVKNQALDGGIKMEVSFVAEPGSLPRLRFGRAYQLRARTVDLAGNSLKLEEADAVLKHLAALGRPLPVLPAVPAPPAGPTPALPPHPADFIYRRFEPVISPVIVPREAFTEGESLERLVIRSNRGQGAVAYAVQLKLLVAGPHTTTLTMFLLRPLPNAPPEKSISLQVTVNPAAPAGDFSVTEQDDGRSLTLKLGQRLTVSLEGNPATGFLWRVASDPAPVLTQQGNPQFTPTPSATDGRGTQVFQFLATAARSAESLVYSGVNERHVAAPKTSQWMVETSGLLDDSFGPRTGESAQDAAQRRARLYAIACKEKGRLSDLDPVTGTPVGRPAVEEIHPAPENALGGYFVHREPQLRLPYPPDPLSRGMALFGLPGVAAGQDGLVKNGNLTFASSSLPQAVLDAIGSVTRIDFGADWPERVPFRLQLAEPLDPDGASALPTWDSQARVLTLHLAKAEQATFRFSSLLGPDDLDTLGIWQWMIEWNAEQGLVPPEAATALAGALWMITPFREISLVHAVQQPLKEPKILSIKTLREEGSTFAYVGADVAVHGKSTAKLELLASWLESVDRPEDPEFHEVTTSAHVFEMPIHLPGQEDSAGPPPDPNAVPVATYDPVGDVVHFLAPPSPPGGGPPSPKLNFLSRHEFGDTKHRKVTYKPVATSRFREFFPREVSSDPARLRREGEVVVNDVLSTTRPPAPKVLYVLPTFQWQRPDDRTQPRKRLGGGVRVYLDRPWFSSGEGELLGVVLADAANYPPSEAQRPFVTQWGVDPIFQSSPTTQAPLLSNFPNVSKTKGLEGVIDSRSLEELSASNPLLPPGGDLVHVAGHEVQFDNDRKLWACDIQINAGLTYFPFVRLALVRFQPSSLPGLELSRVVLADFVQLVPERTVTLSPVPSPGDPDRETFKFTLEGLTYQSNAWTQAPAEDASVLSLKTMSANTDFSVQNDPQPPLRPPLVTVHVEGRIPGTQDEAGWGPTEIQVQVDGAALAGQPSGTGTSLWSGRVSLPRNRPAGQFRVVIQEFEHLLTDERDPQKIRVKKESEAPPGHPPLPPQVITLPFTFSPGGNRLVFAETYEL